MARVLVRDAAAEDAAGLADIYNHYVAHSAATFEETAVDAAAMTHRMAEVHDSGLPWLIAGGDDRIAGYAYAGKWKGRCAYRYSVESTVYVHPDATGQGIGTCLYEKLLKALRERGIHTVIGGIALPNPASIALHEKLGFVQIACFREVGYKFGRWIDVGYWQAILATKAAGREPRPAS